MHPPYKCVLCTGAHQRTHKHTTHTHAESPPLYKLSTEQPGRMCSESRAPGQGLTVEAEALQSLNTGPVQTCLARDSHVRAVRSPRRCAGCCQYRLAVGQGGSRQDQEWLFPALLLCYLPRSTSANTVPVVFIAKA